MSAYIIGNISIKDPQKWAEYRSQVPMTLVPVQAELIFHGEQTAVLSGEYHRSETIVIRFPDTDAVTRWYNSDAYQQLIPLRLQAADVDLVSFKNYPTT